MNVLLFHELEKGTLFPSEDGLLLCSPRFREEAESWAKNHQTDEHQVFVVGLGGGFHIEALLRRCPRLRVTVIDNRPGLKNIFEAREIEGRERVELVFIDSIEGLYQHEVMQVAAAQGPQVFVFKPCFGSQAAFLGEVFRDLTGRSLRALLFLLPRMGFAGDLQGRLTEEGRLLNIRDLGVVIDTFHEGHPKASAVRILRELIV